MNETIRNYAKAKRVKLWMIAEKLGIWDTNFSKMLRHPISPADEKTILEIIDAIAKNRGAD